MSLFDEYEQEFTNAARLVSTKIGQFNYNNGDADAQKALDSAKKGLGDARGLLKQMEVTARSLEPAARNQIVQASNEHRAHHTGSRRIRAHRRGRWGMRHPSEVKNAGPTVYTHGDAPICYLPGAFVSR